MKTNFVQESDWPRLVIIVGETSQQLFYGGLVLPSTVATVHSQF